jgi:DtxR family Mn-dependent transcriptional regulator
LRKTVETYLKTIYECSFTRQIATNKQLATFLNVAPGSVSAAIANYRAEGLVEQKPYGGIVLSALGQRRVQVLMQRYRLCELWLLKDFKFDLAEIPEQAWQLSDFDSVPLTEKLMAYLGQPTISPFGGALNGPDLLNDGSQALNTIRTGRVYTLKSYLETPRSVAYMQHMGLYLGQQLTLKNIDATTETMCLIDSENRDFLVNAAVAKYIFVF